MWLRVVALGLSLTGSWAQYQKPQDSTLQVQQRPHTSQGLVYQPNKPPQQAVSFVQPLFDPELQKKEKFDEKELHELQKKVHTIRAYASWLSMASCWWWLTSVPIQKKADAGASGPAEIRQRSKNHSESVAYWAYAIYFLGKWFDNLHRLSIHMRPKAKEMEQMWNKLKQNSLTETAHHKEQEREVSRVSMLETASGTGMQRSPGVVPPQQTRLAGSTNVVELSDPRWASASPHKTAQKLAGPLQSIKLLAAGDAGKELEMFDKWAAAVRPWLQWAEWFQHMDANFHYMHQLLTVRGAYYKYLASVATKEKLGKEYTQSSWDGVVDANIGWLQSYGYACWEHVMADTWVDGHIKTYEKVEPEKYKGTYNKGYGPVNYGPFWVYSKITPYP